MVLQKRLSIATSGDESASPPIPRSVTQSPSHEPHTTNSGSLGSDKGSEKVIIVKVIYIFFLLLIFDLIEQIFFFQFKTQFFFYLFFIRNFFYFYLKSNFFCYSFVIIIIIILFIYFIFPIIFFFFIN